MECLTVDLGVHQPRSAATSSSGHTVGRCHHDTIVIGRLSDLATPILLQICAMGKTLPKARIEFMRADGQGKPVKYFEIELENVLAGEVAPEVSEGQPMSEHLALAYSKIKWGYTQHVTRDIEFRGMPFRKGDNVIVALPLANLDEDAFPDPMAIDVDRPQNAHIAFGGGPHRYIGSNIARQQWRITYTWVSDVPVGSK